MSLSPTHNGWLPPGGTTLVDLVRERSDARPGHPLYSFLDGEGKVSEGMTLGELDERARAIAAFLQQEGEPGDRALLLFPAGLEFVAAFFGCLYAGVTAVPIKAPAAARLQHSLDPIRATVADCAPRFVLAPQSLKSVAAPFLEGDAVLGAPRWVASDELPLEAAGLWREPRIGADTLALLQYTSGSTSQPRGVMVSHGNLLFNQELIRNAFRQDGDSRILSWLPHYHDMGLIGGILQPLYVDGRCFLMSPVSFLQSPLRWLRSISELRATTSGGPNFAFDLCVDRIGAEQRAGLDLSGWKVAFNGAEPIRPETMERFAAAFAASGFRPGAFHPCYGLAEATLMVSGAQGGEGPSLREVDRRALLEDRVTDPAGDTPVRLVGSGQVMHPLDVRIVDPHTLLPAAAGTVGEVWVSGASVAGGYWQRPAESEETFAARCGGEGAFLRTGDLGFVEGGELFVTGRLKDLIILRGANHYPQDLERTAQAAHPSLRPGAGAVFTVDREGGEAVVLVQELVARHPAPAELGAVVEEIRGAVAARHEVQLAGVVLVKAGELPMTTSGKIRRQSTRATFLAGGFAPVFRWPDAAATAAAPVVDAGAILAYLRQECASRAGVDAASIDTTRPPRLLGIDSLAAAELSFGVEERFARRVPMGLLFEELSLAQLAEEIAALAPVSVEEERADDSAAHPLSEGQQALWFLHELAPEATQYNLAFALRFLEPVDADRLRAAFREVAARNAVLRTTLVPGPEPRQVVSPGTDVPFRVEELPAGDALREVLRREAETPFDLTAAPPLRVRLLRGGGGDVLLLTLHHIAADLWSLELLAQQVAEAYAAPRPGQPEAGLDYGRFVAWQREMLAGERGRELRGYWTRRFAGELPALDLALDRPRPPLPGFRGGQVDVRLGEELTAKLRELAAARGATLFSTLLAGFFVLLSRHSGQRRLLVGAPAAGRSRAEFRDVLGYFVNLMGIDADLSGGITFGELLGQVQKTVGGALMHSDYPFKHLVRELQPERDLSRSPLFEAVFSLQNGRRLGADVLAPFMFGRESGPLEIGGLRVQALEAPVHASPFDLSLLLVEGGKHVEGVFQFRAELFDEATIERMLAHFRRILEQVAEDAARPVAALELLDEEERRRVVSEWNPAQAPAPFQPVTAHFRARAAEQGERPALVDGARTLSYAELDQHSNRLAQHLLSLGLGAEDRVALVLPRGIAPALGALAVLKSGAAYVSLDASLPAERLRYMIEDSGARLVIAGDEVPAPGCAAPLLRWSEVEARLPSCPADDPRVEIAPGQLAYVIYTSGSTGRPKGVMVPHGGLSSLVAWHQAAYALQPRDRAPLLAGLGFDASVWELWPYLSSGASLHVVPDEVRASAEALQQFIEEHELTLAFVPTVMAEALLRRPWKTGSLRALLTGGEKLSGRNVADLPFAVVNHYGPTENTVVATAGAVTAGEGSPSIGAPLQHVRAYVLDEEMKPVPVGVPGELYLAGAGVARGYAGRARETAGAFVPDPFSGHPGGRLYRTGDRVRWLAAGELEFLGRADQQVKIRGYRIELGEIEAVLRAQAGVRDAVVVVRGGGRLDGYVVADDAEEATLREALGRKLPEYMVPARIIALEALPLTPNGKVDRKALPEAEPASAEYVAPRTATEERLAAIWAEVLGRERVGATENFFHLGGHSLLATQLVSRIRESFTAEVPLRAVFEAPTVEKLARRVDAAQYIPATSFTPLPRDGESVLPLSFAQERLWFLEQLDPGKPTYNIPLALRIQGPLDEDALQRALGEVIRRHEILRGHVEESGGVRRLVVEEWPEWGWQREDLAALEPEERESRVALLAQQDARAPFDLSRGPLIRARFLKVARDEAVLLLAQHHIVSDAWSLGVLIREVSGLYQAFREGRPSPLAPLAVQYADFAAWQRQWLAEGAEAEQVAYWREQLAGFEGYLDLPLDHPRPAVQSFAGEARAIQLDAGLTRKLEALALREGATMYMLLLASFQLLLHRYSGQGDIAVGSPVAGRGVKQVEELIGFFVNTLVLRSRVRAGERFADFLARTRETALGAYAHQDVPFERLVEEVQPERSLAHTPLFQVMFAIQDVPGELESALAPDLHVSVRDAEATAAKFDQSWTVTPGEDGVRVAVEYNRDLFEGETIERMLAHFRRILEQVADDATRPVAALELLDEEERRRVVTEWNPVQAPVSFQPVTAHFRARAAEQGDRPALVDGARTLSYAELDQHSNRLAQHLLSLGLGAEDRVALVLARGVEPVLAQLAVLKSGAAYVSLDASLPAERLRYMIEDSGARLVIAGDEVPAPGCAAPLLRWSEVEARLPSCPADDPRVEIAPGQLAYVIYTSGSTGRPKGVMVPHGGLSSLVAWHQTAYAPQPGDRAALLAGLGFDASVWELWPYLSSGASLHVVPDEVRASAEALQQFIEERKLTLAFVPTVMAEALLRRTWKAGSLRALLTGGEKLSGRNVADLPFAVINHYGPTENTVVATAGAVTAGEGSPSIGAPIPHVRAYVLDEEMKPVPVGVPGELYLAGSGVARGYAGRARETAGAFVPDPFSGHPGGRLYRTGDRVRWLAAGELEFLGRADQQVKIRGYRIELGEIEAVLRAQAGVRDAVVVVRGGGRLDGYVVADDAEEATLREALGRKLPEYMVPARIIALEALPLTPNGKVDRKALPEAEPASAEYVAPRTATEERLAAIWAEVLGRERVGATENFFHLGGHSLLATQLVSRIRESFAAEVPLRAVFEAPTLEHLARHVDDARRGHAPPAIRREPASTAPLSFSQERLWFLEHLQPGSPIYHMAGAVRLAGALDADALAGSLDDLAARHEILRTTFRTVDGQPSQEVAEARPVALEVLDLADVDDEIRAERLQQRTRQEVERPFDLARGPLFRTLLIRLRADEHLLLFVMHHIVSDGWSIGVLTAEVASFYEARVLGTPAALAPLPIQYADFARWQREWLRGEVLDAHVGYWRERLAEPLPALPLRTDRPRPAVQSFAGARLPVHVPRALTERMNTLAREEGATLFMVLLAGFQALLSRATGQEDVLVGTLIANRNRAELENLIGFFVNAIPLRTDLSGNPDFRELLARVREATLGAYAHQDLPFEKLVEAVQPERDLSRAPLFQVMLVLQNVPAQPTRLPRLEVEMERVETHTSAIDLTLTLAESGEGLDGSIEYNTDLFDPATMDRLRKQLLALLEAATANPSGRLLELPLLTRGEQADMVRTWNETDADFPLDRCFHELFEDQAARTPDAVAASHGERSLTYAQLEARANRFARQLLAEGAEPEEVVALLGGRDLDFLAAVLGIFKAGACYLPLDPAHPPARLRQVMQQSRARLAVASAGYRAALEEALAEGAARVLELEAMVEAAQPEHAPARRAHPMGLAYVLFTSGSTGTPKGAMIHHRGMLNHLFAKVADLGLTERDVVAQTASQCFDISVWQLLAPLLAGGRVHIYDEGDAHDPALLLGTTARQGVTVLEVVPSLLRELIEELRRVEGDAGLGRLRWMVATGEALPPELVAGWLRLFPATPVMNAYGPTECSDDVTHHVMTMEPAEGETQVPIGRALHNTRLYVLDAAMNPVPVGIAGELHVGGAGVGRGYLHSPERTARAFIPDPFSPRPGGRLYRTGDLARYRVDGTLEFLGRIDHQVKVRGFRIELGEIESVLLRHPAVREAVVVSDRSPAGHDQLVAYFVPAGDAAEGEELADDQVSHWQMIFGGVYAAAEDADPSLDTSGWTSSYTGLAIPQEEMREWVEGTVDNVMSHRPRRVLELGCGTGMLLLRIAPHCEEYWGTDLTRESIDTLGRYVAGREGLEGVRLFNRPADDFQGIPEGAFDTVILNSVAQYFPGIDYLVRVLKGAVASLRDGGVMYLGDIRSLPMLPVLHFSTAHFQAGDAVTRDELGRRVQAGIDQEHELAVDPAFFLAVRERIPRVAAIDIQLKRGHSSNELTRFRYDVVIRVGADRPEPPRLEWRDWEEGALAGVERALAGERPELLALRGVPNARVQREAAGVAWLRGEDGADSRGESEALLREREGEGVDPEDWRELAARHGYTAGVHPSHTGDLFRYDVVLARGPRPFLAGSAPGELMGWQAYANRPLQRSSAERSVPEIREHLRERLPDYMVPSVFIPLQKMPLTRNGKVDRKALPAPDRGRAASSLPLVAPRGATEEAIAAVWRQVLGIEQCGTADRFFDVGGDSLKIVKVFRMLNERYPGRLSVVDLFRYNTVRELGEFIDAAGKPAEAAPLATVEAFEI